MGYCSDVCMAIRAPKEWLIAEVATMRLAGDEARQQALDELTLIEDGNNKDFAVLYLHGNCKWYAGYPDVAAIEAVWEHFIEVLELGENPDGAGLEDPRRSIDMAFVRIGEDDNDVETRYHGSDHYDLVCLNRSVAKCASAVTRSAPPRLSSVCQSRPGTAQ